METKKWTQKKTSPLSRGRLVLIDFTEERTALGGDGGWRSGGGGIHLREVINRANSEVAGAGEVSEHYFTLLE